MLSQIDARGPSERLHCLLQIGYFKAKQAFFSFSTQHVPAEDIAFLLERYFPETAAALQPLRPSELYAQRNEVVELFGYRLWSESDRPVLVEMATTLARRDVTPTFVLIEVLASRRVALPTFPLRKRTLRLSVDTDAPAAALCKDNRR